MPCERDLDQVDAGDAPTQREQLAAARPAGRVAAATAELVLAPLHARRWPPVRAAAIATRSLR
jgi:hypothetical protein